MTAEQARSQSKYLDDVLERVRVEREKYPEPTPFPNVDMSPPRPAKFDWSGKDLLAARDRGYQGGDGDAVLLTKTPNEGILPSERNSSMHQFKFIFAAALIAVSGAQASSQEVAEPVLLDLVVDLAELDLDDNGLVERYEVVALLDDAEGDAHRSWIEEWNATYSIVGMEPPTSATFDEWQDVLRQGITFLDVNNDGVVTLDEAREKVRESEDVAFVFSEIPKQMADIGADEIQLSQLQLVVGGDPDDGVTEVGPGKLPTNFNKFRASVLRDFGRHADGGVIDLKAQ